MKKAILDDVCVELSDGQCTFGEIDGEMHESYSGDAKNASAHFLKHILIELNLTLYPDAITQEQEDAAMAEMLELIRQA